MKAFSKKPYRQMTVHRFGAVSRVRDLPWWRTQEGMIFGAAGLLAFAVGVLIAAERSKSSRAASPGSAALAPPKIAQAVPAAIPQPAALPHDPRPPWEIDPNAQPAVTVIIPREAVQNAEAAGKPITIEANDGTVPPELTPEVTLPAQSGRVTPETSEAKPSVPSVSAHEWWADWYRRKLDEERLERKAEWKRFYDLGVAKGKKLAK